MKGIVCYLVSSAGALALVTSSPPMGSNEPPYLLNFLHLGAEWMEDAFLEAHIIQARLFVRVTFQRDIQIFSISGAGVHPTS